MKVGHAFGIQTALESFGNAVRPSDREGVLEILPELPDIDSRAESDRDSEIPLIGTVEVRLRYFNVLFRERHHESSVLSPESVDNSTFGSFFAKSRIASNRE